MINEMVKDMKLVGEIIADDAPIACSLNETELVTRGVEVKDLFKGIEQVEELEDGYALRFPGSVTSANNLTEFITFERDCCPFFTFALVFEPKQGSIWLNVRGPEGVKAMVEEMIPTRERSNSR
jgi:hypothetical protein